MSSQNAAVDFDVAIVGGGIAGAALAGSLANAGARVLVCERETVFRDRVRGEALLPWGVLEARALHIEDVICRAGGHKARYWDTYLRGQAPRRRDLEQTSAGRYGLHFHHPVVQEAVLENARSLGATVWRGAVVRDLTEGLPPSCTVQLGEQTRLVSARLIVVATGRSRRLQKQLGRTVREEPKRTAMTGVLLSNVSIAEDAAHVVQDMQRGSSVLMFPLGAGRVRAYLAYDVRSGARGLSHDRLGAFLEECTRVGVPAEWTAHAQAEGPLASFEAHHTWIEQPYRGGVAFIGDAAGTSDPCFGEGISLTLRDVRVLRDALLADDDWQAAASRYALQRNDYFAALRRIEGWLTEVFYTAGPDADLLRARVLPRMGKGAGPDVIGKGPDSQSDQAAYEALFG